MSYKVSLNKTDLTYIEAISNLTGQNAEEVVRFALANLHDKLCGKPEEQGPVNVGPFVFPDKVVIRKEPIVIEPAVIRKEPIVIEVIPFSPVKITTTDTSIKLKKTYCSTSY